MLVNKGSARRDFILITTPNTGSTWLAKILAKHSDAPYYDKEFFNPSTNPVYRDVIAEEFGCELIGCYRNIARPIASPALEEMLRRTWWRHGWRFNKEVYAAFKLDALQQFFDTAILWRRFDEVFPPLRSRVWGWYEAIYVSAIEAGLAAPIEGGLFARAMEGWRLAWQEIDECAADAPRIDHDLLMTAGASNIAVHLAQLNGMLPSLRCADAAAEIVATREPRPKTWRDLN